MAQDRSTKINSMSEWIPSDQGTELFSSLKRRSCASQTLSLTMYSLISFRKASPPQNRQLSIFISNIKQSVDDFVSLRASRGGHRRIPNGVLSGHQPCSSPCMPYSLLPAPYSLLPTPCCQLLTSCSLLPTPYSLLPTPYSLLDKPSPLNPQP